MTYAIIHTVGSISTRIEGPTPHGVMDLLALHEAREQPWSPICAGCAGKAETLKDESAIAPQTPDVTPTPPPLKWGCLFLPHSTSGYNVMCPNEKYRLGMYPGGLQWVCVDGWVTGSGFWNSREAALSALAQCTTPPPGYQA